VNEGKISTKKKEGERRDQFNQRRGEGRGHRGGCQGGGISQGEERKLRKIAGRKHLIRWKKRRTLIKNPTEPSGKRTRPNSLAYLKEKEKRETE